MIAALLGAFGISTLLMIVMLGILEWELWRFMRRENERRAARSP